jgi:hypothetical protein
MDQQRPTPPAAEDCLILSDASRGQKGGTLIDESVLDVAGHEALLRTPDGYRPGECKCGSKKLHVHDRRRRTLRGSRGADGAGTVVTVMVFLCVSCRATWRVLPAFLARCLLYCLA